MVSPGAIVPERNQSTSRAVVLFTAFEPSGDDHAAPVIAGLVERAPDLNIYAWGGPKMEAAGATLISSTADDGGIGLGAWRRASMVRREKKRIKQWCRGYRVLAHVAVDSPAANFPICKVTHRSGARVVHLVAPQLWAWGGSRIRKLRRLTDHVLCLLPFEEQWFKDRGVPASFIGHPAMNREIDEEAIRPLVHGLPQGAPRIALLPGSRTGEVKANMPLLAAAFAELQGRHSGACGVIVAANPQIAALVRRKIRVFPTGLHMVTDQLDAVLTWCDLAIAAAGTITLHITRHLKPMIGVYKVGPLSWLGAKLILRTPHRLLPNIIAGREICPEFVPHLGGAMPIVEAATTYLRDSRHAAVQSEALRRVCLRFSNKRPAHEAARTILELIGREKAES